MSRKKRLISNFLSLVVLQGTNYILPLMLIPYLVRVLGPDKYGTVVFAQSIIQYFLILTNYGFELSVTKSISISRNDEGKISKIYSTVLFIKILLSFISFLLLTILIISSQKFTNDWLLYYLSFIIVIGSSIFPSWLFQGLEKMKYITILNLISKFIITILIFLLIKNSDDYLLYAFLNSFGYIIIGVISQIIIFKKLGIKICKVSLNDIVEQLKDSWHVFLSQLSVSFYTSSNTVILGLFTNNTIVGYYAAAEKLVRAVQGLFFPIYQATFPFISNAINESVENGLKIIKKIFRISGILTLLVSIILFLSADLIALFILGDNFTQSIIILKILCLIPFFAGLNNILGVQIMLNLNMKKAFSNITIISGIFNIIMSITLTFLLGYIGTAISLIITEFIMVTAMYLYLFKKNYKIY